MTEKLKLQGRRAELKEKIEDLQFRAENHIMTIRNLVDPYENFYNLKTKQALQAMKSLDIIVDQAKEAKAQLDKINTELGV